MSLTPSKELYLLEMEQVALDAQKVIDAAWEVARIYDMTQNEGAALHYYDDRLPRFRTIEEAMTHLQRELWVFRNAHEDGGIA